MYINVYRYISIFRYAYTHTYIHAYLPAYIHTYMHLYVQFIERERKKDSLFESKIGREPCSSALGKIEIKCSAQCRHLEG